MMKDQIKPSILLYFTAAYPFGTGEQFIQNEIDGLCTKFDKVFLIPFDTSKQLTKIIPANCEVIDLNKADSAESKRVHFIFLFRILLNDIIYSGKSKQILKNIRFLFGSLKQSYLRSLKIEKVILECRKKKYKINAYSTWMDENSLSLAMLKKLNKIGSYSFKMRGYDLFDERRPGGYMPFRKFIFEQADSILTMSEQGADYLRNKNICSDKISHNYPGIQSFGRNEIKEGVFTLVSCSGLWEWKRVSVIAKALEHISFKLKWIHFGGGLEMDHIEEIVSQLPNNIIVELKGDVENNVVRDYYLNQKVDGFIHVSETEGFGYAIIEAYCSAIPAILYPAGGVIELIDSSFAQKVSSPLSPKSLAEDIVAFKEKFEDNIEAKEKAFNFYLNNFQVEPNCEELYNILTIESHV